MLNYNYNHRFIRLSRISDFNRPWCCKAFGVMSQCCCLKPEIHQPDRRLRSVVCVSL